MLASLRASTSSSSGSLKSARSIVTSKRLFTSSTPRKADVTLTIDGKSVTVPAGSTILQAAEIAGTTIPRFCYHDRLAIAGNCRMCLVEVKPGPPKPQASCAMPALNGQVVSTNSPVVHKAREGVMEFLLANHPLDCPICDQGGECDLQDQSMRYGSDRTRFHEITGKRAVENKDFGPLVKTSMNRCIQCTRCVRFANEVAGVEEFGTTGRGNDMQIGTYVEKILDSEMSGNIVDLCPVGALTSKPYAFTSRPWELKKTESIDVMDGVGSNIRVDSRGVQVMRVQPRINDEVNQEWINDKTRYAYDGLRFQRLTSPLVRVGERFEAVGWGKALEAIKNGLERSGAKGDEIVAVAGGQADTESLVALKDLTNKLGSESLTLDQPLGSSPPSHGVDIRSNYIFNTTIASVDEADAVLLIGTNLRHEAAIINTRFRASYLHSPVVFGLVGPKTELTYEYEHIGENVSAAVDFLKGKQSSLGGEFGKAWAKAEKPMVIVGSGVAETEGGKAVFEALAKLASGKGKGRLVKDGWNGVNVVQRTASRTAAYDIGFAPTPTSSKTTPKFMYLLGADEIPASSIPTDAFVVYQGSHGDVGAQFADVILPGSAYTEKSSTWVNTEGRSQMGRAAVPAPGAAREDWQIIRALSEVLGAPLPYDDLITLRDRLWDISPTLVRYDTVETPSADIVQLGFTTLAKNLEGSKATKEKMEYPIKDFYMTDAISRSSTTMAQASKAFTHKQYKINVANPDAEGPAMSDFASIEQQAMAQA